MRHIHDNILHYTILNFRCCSSFDFLHLWPLGPDHVMVLRASRPPMPVFSLIVLAESSRCIWLVRCHVCVCMSCVASASAVRRLRALFCVAPRGGVSVLRFPVHLVSAACFYTLLVCKGPTQIPISCGFPYCPLRFSMWPVTIIRYLYPYPVPFCTRLCTPVLYICIKDNTHSSDVISRWITPWYSLATVTVW